MNKITFLKNLTLCLTWIIAKNAVYVYIFGHTLLQISHVKQTSIVFLRVECQLIIFFVLDVVDHNDTCL